MYSAALSRRFGYVQSPLLELSGVGGGSDPPMFGVCAAWDWGFPDEVRLYPRVCGADRESSEPREAV